MFLKKSIRIISLLVCISTTTCVKSERPCLWISLMSAGCVVTMVVGGLLGNYFPSPILQGASGNLTPLVGALGGGGAYIFTLGVGACAKACHDGVCCN